MARPCAAAESPLSSPVFRVFLLFDEDIVMCLWSRDPTCVQARELSYYHIPMQDGDAHLSCPLPPV